MSVRQMGFLCRALRIAALVALSSCGGKAAGPAGPPATESEPDAAPGVPKPVPDVGTVTPPTAQGDAAAPTPDQGTSTPPPVGGPELVVEAGSLDRENTIVSFPFAAGAGKWFVLRDGQGG